jgi:hypothetical protein
LTGKNVFGIDSVSATGKGVVRMEAKMPGDPKECRQRALNCMFEVKVARTPQERESFATLARSWIKLAEELEWTQALLAKVDEFDEPPR